MPKSKAQVISIAAERDAQEGKKAFLELLHDDISQNPGRIEPIPSSLLDRMARIREKASAGRARADLLEG